MLEVRNLSFSYGRKRVLRDVSFVVSPGEVVGVVGDNGAGKTALLRLLATLAVPDDGAILLDGRSAFAHPLAYRRQLGWLPSCDALADDMTVRNYLEYRARLKGEGARRIRRRLSEAVEMCGMSGFADVRIGRLSAGQRSRVAFADAILLRPRVLLLDDFPVGLDSSFRERMSEILAEVAGFSSVIVAGNEVDDFVSWVTRFLVLKEGSIAAAIPSAGVAPDALLGRVRAALMKGEG